MNAGVGVVGLAHYMAKNKLLYTSEKGKEAINKMFEKHSYYVIKASLKLGKELGNAPWMSRTKWPEGWLPIDTYNRNVDAVASSSHHYDWESLREEIIKNGGIRNSSLINHMPTESSSKISGTTNSVYAIRELTLMKTDSTNVVYWAAPEGDRLGKWYERAWDIPTKDMTDVYAIIQKWADQSISADFYRKIIGSDTVTTQEMLTNHFYMTKMGMKTRYYINSYTSSSGTTNTDSEESCESCTL
jgi:ribonucleoside-diphosphate reductase alpha chain